MKKNIMRLFGKEVHGLECPGCKEYMLFTESNIREWYELQIGCTNPNCKWNKVIGNVQRIESIKKGNKRQKFQTC